MNNFLKTYFGAGGTVSKSLAALFILINIIVGYNAFTHNPYIGYDAREHIEYIDILSERRLPSLEENYEFFSPPLPYLAPALAKASGLTGEYGAARAFLIINLFCSVMSMFLILALWHLVRPENISPARNTLLLLALMPVYYKSFSMVRAEPMFMTFTLAVIWMVLKTALLANTQERGKELLLACACGLLLGLAMLTRPWTGFLIIALGLFWLICIMKASGQAKMRVFRSAAASVLIAILVSSWFYIHLKKDYGSFTAFNRRGAESFSFSNQSPYFYFGSGNGDLFSDPVRPSFVNQLLPILYSDTWGDYWCYFQVRGIKVTPARVSYTAGSELIPPLNTGVTSNRDTITPALARNNIAGILPTILLIAGFIYAILMAMDYARKKVNITSALPEALSFICLVASVIGFAGYMWFLIMYPHPAEGDTIKATYILQLFPLICIPTGNMLARLEEKHKKLYLAACAILVIILVHNLPTFLTRYPL